MGKPYWSAAEEEYFANVIIPQSLYATGVHVPRSGLEFAVLAPRMQAELDRRGVSRRTYTGDGLFQHWYQRYGKRAKARHQHTSEQPLTKATTPGGLTSLKKRNTPSSQPGNTPNSTRSTPDDRRPGRQPLLPRYADFGSQTRVTVDPLADTDGREEMGYGATLRSDHPDDVFADRRGYTPPGLRTNRSQFPGSSSRARDYGRHDEMDEYDDDLFTPSKPPKTTQRSGHHDNGNSLFTPSKRPTVSFDESASKRQKTTGTQRQESSSDSQAVMGGQARLSSRRQTPRGMSMSDALREALRMHNEGRLPRVRTQSGVTPVRTGLGSLTLNTPNPTSERGAQGRPSRYGRIWVPRAQPEGLPTRQVRFGRRRGQLRPIIPYPPEARGHQDVPTTTLLPARLGPNDPSYTRDPDLPPVATDDQPKST